MSSPKLLKRFRVPLYGFTVYIYSGKSPRKTDDQWKTVVALTELDDTYSKIFVHFDYDKPFDTSVAAHEAVHAALMILEYRGIKTTEENSEPMAYLVQYLMEQMMPAMIKEEKRHENESTTTA